MKIDSIDRQLLQLLQEDATRALDSLGEEVGLSRNACWRRIKSLESEGVIKSRVTLLDPKEIGLELTVFVSMRTVSRGKDAAETIRKVVADTPEILDVYRLTGDQDYLLRAQIADVPSYDALYQKLVEQVELADISASFAMEEIKHTTALPV
ncbi:MAG: Lrp/AsnC family transcriptional regulator [Pseudomonadota bacterium]